MMSHKYLEVFVDGLSNYFAHLDVTKSVRSGMQQKSFQIGTPYLLDRSDALGLDYTGRISISGTNSGQVSFSASSTLLKMILIGYGVTSLSEEKHKDIVGEVANTIAGNARRVLGSAFNISAPTVVKGAIKSEDVDLKELCYVLPVRWKNNPAQLIINLDVHEEHLH